MIAPADPAELDGVVELIAAEQVRPERNITYLGVEPAGIRAELEDLDPPWTETVRVARRDGALVGAVLADWDVELGRAWVHGPWVAGGDEDWRRWARPLVDAAIAQLPAAIDDIEISGELVNERLAQLAAELGWEPTVANYAYVLGAPAVAAWDHAAAPDDHAIRSLRADDGNAIGPLHDAEFPATYLPVERMIAEATAGTRLALALDAADGTVIGYATGQVQPDGEGYIDFVAVVPVARGGGAGRTLVMELSRRLLAASSTGRVNLTVQEHRAPARALYERLGFTVDSSFRGYRRQPAEG